MKKYNFKEGLIGVVIFISLIVISLGGIHSTSKSVKVEQREFLEKAIRRAVVECYALEGMYPPDTKYIEDNYGVMINREKYIVHYEVFASNIMPDVVVLEKGGGE